MPVLTRAARNQTWRLRVAVMKIMSGILSCLDSWCVSERDGLSSWLQSQQARPGSILVFCSEALASCGDINCVGPVTLFICAFCAGTAQCSKRIVWGICPGAPRMTRLLVAWVLLREKMNIPHCQNSRALDTSRKHSDASFDITCTVCTVVWRRLRME